MGFDVPFIQPLPDHLKCPICLTAFENAMQTTCGHLFCKSCLDRLTVPECSVCKAPLQDTGVFPDRHVQREVMGLHLNCPNTDCKWTGTVKDYLARHSESCDFEEIKCPHAECGAKYLRRDKKRHTERACKHRMMTCRRCRKQVPAALMKEHNSAQCAAGFVHCPAKCGRTLIQRSAVDTHLQSCPLSPAECPFANVGCKKKLLRQEEKIHLVQAASYHISLLVQSTTRESLMKNIRARDVQEVLQEAITSPALAEVVRSQNETASSLPGGIAELQLQMKELSEQVKNQTMQVVAAEGRPEAALGTVASAGSAMAVGLASAMDLEDPRLPEVSERVMELERGKGMMDRSLGELSTTIADMDLRLNVCEFATYDGVLTWKIPSWSERRTDALNSRNVSIYSQPFFTSYHGYKCCTRLYPNGDGAGLNSHASLFFVIMQNDYDAIQDWPFNRKVTFTLVNQMPDKPNISETFRPDVNSSSFQRPLAAMNVASGCPKFAELRKIEDPSTGFLKDDTIFIRVTVDPGRGQLARLAAEARTRH